MSGLLPDSMKLIAIATVNTHDACSRPDEERSVDDGRTGEGRIDGGVGPPPRDEQVKKHLSMNARASAEGEGIALNENGFQTASDLPEC